MIYIEQIIHKHIHTYVLMYPFFHAQKVPKSKFWMNSNMEVVSAAPPAGGKCSRGKKQTGSILDMLKGKPASSKEKENVRNDEDEDESCAGANADNRKGKGKKEISEEELAVKSASKKLRRRRSRHEKSQGHQGKAAIAARAAKAERKAQREAASTGKKSSRSRRRENLQSIRFHYCKVWQV